MMRGFHHPKLPNSNSFAPRNLLHQIANLTRHWPMKMGFSSFSTPQIAGSSSICKAFRHICCQFPLKIRPGTPTRTKQRFGSMQQKRGEKKMDESIVICHQECIQISHFWLSHRTSFTNSFKNPSQIPSHLQLSSVFLKPQASARAVVMEMHSPLSAAAGRA